MKTLAFTSILVVVAVPVLTACGGGGGNGNGGSPPGPFAVDADTVALWHFDEGQGQIAYDASPNHHDLHLGPTVNSELQDPYWADGRFGPCLHYVMAEQDYTTAQHAVTLPSNEASVELWYRALVGEGVLFNAGFICFRLSWASGPTPELWFGIGDDTGWDSMQVDAAWSSVVRDGAWHYVAATYDGTTLRVYVDGHERAAAVGGRVLAVVQELHVGGRPQNTFVAGDIDEVRFSRRARTAPEILEYWQSVPP